MAEASGAKDVVISTGIEGFDRVLRGGLPAGHTYLIEGNSGSGKTTLGLSFCREGIERGEKCLYIALSETESELHGIAASHGWSLSGLHILEAITINEAIEPQKNYTMFHPSEVELSETTRRMLSAIDSIQPARVVIDSLTEMRLLCESPLRFRRQLLGMKSVLADKKATVLLLDTGSGKERDIQVESLVHGAIVLDQTPVHYGSDRRRLRVEKIRGLQYWGGFHDFVIRRGALEVFPRLIAASYRTVEERREVKSGVPKLDDLAGGGFPAGSSTLLIGPSGSGKSTIAAQYAASAAKRGEKAAIFSFDERVASIIARTKAMGIDLDEPLQEGRLTIQQVDPAELTPGQFAADVQRAVEKDAARLVVIDTLNGYLNAMPDEDFLIAQLHELLTYLGHQGVLTLLVVAQHGVLGNTSVTPVDASYLADNILMIRFFEAAGEVRRAISVMKKRGGPHERTIRELRLSAEGIHIGDPLHDFQGVLSGIPSFTGEAKTITRASDGREE